MISSLHVSCLYEFLVCLMRVTCPVHFVLFYSSSLIISGEGYKLWSSSFCSFLLIFYIVSLRSKYYARHRVLKRNLCSSLKIREPIFELVQNNWWNNGVSDFNLYVRILDRNPNRNEYQKFSWRKNRRPGREIDNLTAIYESIVWIMWEPRRLTTLWASTACYRDSFIFYTRIMRK
jgi:hypothetical protein